MPAAVDGNMPPLEAHTSDMDKTDLGFDASFGLNPMSADDPSWIGHGFQAQAAEDFLSSPDWTDPSPALTDSMSFELDSCGPSPLLPLEGYEDEYGVPGIAGAPLFPQQDGYASSNISPFELAQNDFGPSTSGDFGTSQMGADFTLFPETKKVPAEMAFNRLSRSSVSEEQTATLYHALTRAALSNVNVGATLATSSTTAPAMTASPLAFSFKSDDTVAAPLAPAATAAPVAADEGDSSGSKSPLPCPVTRPEIRGTKRRLDSADLLPLDAPIQKRTYLSASATSRRDTEEEDDVFAEEEAAIRRETDPRIAKRLSNTLAARRSRHRKAEELRLLHEHIESLQREVESWKSRCKDAERERDEARAQL